MFTMPWNRCSRWAGARTIFAKAKAYRHFGAVLPPAGARWLLDSISEDIKKATFFRPHEVSVAAAEEARLRGVDDLSVKTREDQPAFDPGRDVFVVEHMAPVRGLVYACVHQPTVDGVLDVLTRRIRVVWLLRREERALGSLGFRYRRAKHPPALVELTQPDEAYRRAGIAIARTPGGGRT